MRTSVSRLFVASFAALLLLAAMPASIAVASKENPAGHADKGDKFLALTLGKAKVVNLPGSVSDVMVADPSIAEVTAIQANRLYVVGLSLGDTNIITLNASGDVLSQYNVHVGIDTAAIEENIRKLFPNETSVEVKTIGDRLVLTGNVSTPATAEKITRFVAGHIDAKGGTDNVDTLVQNLLSVDGEQQVMLRVRIIEATRQILRELGTETSINDPNELSRDLFGRDGLNSLGSTASGGLGIDTRNGLTQDPFGIGRMIFDTGVAGIGFVELLINALESDGLVKILAEPNLTAISGEEAGFLAGGEFPYPAGRDQDGNITVKFRKFGVSLSFKPVVLDENRINLQMDSEVSSLDFNEGVELDNTTVPGLDVRRTTTTVEMGSGASLMISGLIKSESVKGVSGLPGIKDTPVLGDLVKSRAFEQQETELVVVVTPYLVKPYAEKSYAEVKKVEPANHVANAFKKNMITRYGDDAASALAATNAPGYMFK